MNEHGCFQAAWLKFHFVLRNSATKREIFIHGALVQLRTVIQDLTVWQGMFGNRIEMDTLACGTFEIRG